MLAERALGWLKPGGCMVTLGTEGILDGNEPWQKTVADVARLWMKRAFPTGWGVDGLEPTSVPGPQNV